MHTGTSIFIRASRETIFPVVSDIGRWPERLPHYRYVKFLGKTDGRDIVKMAATRDGLPISWISAYEMDAQRLELRFEHLHKWTKGMHVVWNLTPTRDGTRVEIAHDLNFRVRALAWIAEPVILKFFVENIAGKTLRGFKRLLEEPAASSAD